MSQQVCQCLGVPDIGVVLFQSSQLRHDEKTLTDVREVELLAIRKEKKKIEELIEVLARKACFLFTF